MGDVHGLIELPELRVGILDAIERAVPCEWASLNDIGADPSQTVVINRPALTDRWHRLFAQYAHQNPLLQHWLQTRDGRAYRFSDVADWTELSERELFRDVYGPLGVRHQIAFTLPSPVDRVLAIALSRGEQDFTDDERQLLNMARPFLVQSYRLALTVKDLSGGLNGAVDLLRGEGLTQRQAEVILHAARGASNRDIGTALGISGRTVQKHLELAYERLGVGNRSQAALRVWALAQGQSR